MNAVSCPLDASPAVSAAKPVPFATVYVTLTKQEHIQLVMGKRSAIHTLALSMTAC